MSLSLSRENGKVIVENRFYNIAFNARVGGTVNHLRNNEAERSLITREGCEIWSSKWGGFYENHYQQERTGKPKFKTHEEDDAIKVKVENVLGNAHSGKTRGAWCINNWVFKKDTPLIHCDAQIGDPDAEQPETAKPNLFKKYICFRPGSYKYWAYKEEDEVVSGLLGLDNLTTHLIKSGAGYSIVFSTRRRWITIFNDTRGFAVILPKGDKTCEDGDLRFWQSKSMEEILYSQRSNEKSQNLSLGYLEYATTPEKKWTPVDDIYEGKGISSNT